MERRPRTRSLFATMAFSIVAIATTTTSTTTAMAALSRGCLFSRQPPGHIFPLYQSVVHRAKSHSGRGQSSRCFLFRLCADKNRNMELKEASPMTIAHEEDTEPRHSSFAALSTDRGTSSVDKERNPIRVGSTSQLKMKDGSRSARTLKSDRITIGIATLATLATLVALISVSGPGGWRYYLAGGICAALSHALATPIDVVKTRQQVDKKLKNMGLIKSTMTIVKDEGIFTLLSGLGPTAAGYLSEGAIKFGIYEAMKPAVKTALEWSAAACSLSFLNSKILGFVICGGVAGTFASVMLCPLEALRIRLVSEPGFSQSGWVDGGLQMMKNEGILGVFKGLSAMLCKQVPYTITKNVSFDFITTMAYAAMKTLGYAVSSRVTTFLIPLVSAMVASVLSCISSQPGDMLLSVVNAHEGTHRTRDFAKDILEEDGVQGFFVGMRSRFVHVGLIVTVQLFIYDFVKRFCGIAATGST